MYANKNNISNVSTVACVQALLRLARYCLCSILEYMYTCDSTPYAKHDILDALDHVNKALEKL